MLCALYHPPPEDFSKGSETKQTTITISLFHLESRWTRCMEDNFTPGDWSACLEMCLSESVCVCVCGPTYTWVRYGSQTLTPFMDIWGFDKFNMCLMQRCYCGWSVTCENNILCGRHTRDCTMRKWLPLKNHHTVVFLCFELTTVTNHSVCLFMVQNTRSCQRKTRACLREKFKPC